MFLFFVFNIGVKLKNRRINMANIRKKNFIKIKQIVQLLDPKRLKKAKIELEISGKTNDREVNQLLKNLSLYGHRQPISKKSRLIICRKIKSLIVRYNIPTIWFTLNPNDITNPMKLRLTTYRLQDPNIIETFLLNFNQIYKRARLIISDPFNSALFFYKEISIFFKYYIKTGEKSIFKRINQYFKVVETNKQDVFHLYNLL